MLFNHAEFDSRLAACQQYLTSGNLDFVVIFEPETVTYHTGFYTDGYGTSFQAAIIPREGVPLTVVRAAEKYYFDDTAAWPDDVLVWSDGETPAQAVTRGLQTIGANGRVAVEGGSWRAPYTLVQEVIAQNSALTFVDIAKGLFHLRAVKSPAEIDYHRAAAHAADAMQLTASEAVQPGLSETELAIIAATAALRAGSDVIDPGPIASGERARHIHAYFSDGIISDNDLVFLEMDASSKRYRSRSMRTVIVGDAEPGFVDAYNRFEEVQLEALATVRAGVSCRVPDRIYREGIIATGWVDRYPNKTFYSMGFMLAPTTFEPLEVTSTADFIFEAGMVFHTYISSRGINVSETIVVTESGYERLTKFDRALIRR